MTQVLEKLELYYVLIGQFTLTLSYFGFIFAAQWDKKP